MHNSKASAREHLFDPEMGVTNESQRLTDASSRLEQTSRTLDQTRRTALETEDIAVGVVTELRVQRDTINRTRGRVDEIDTNLSQARRTIVNMGRQAVQNKLLLSCVSIVLALVIAYIILRKIFH